MPAGTAPRNPPYFLCLSTHVFYFPQMRVFFCAALLTTAVVFLTGCASTGGVGRFRTVVLDAGHGGIDRGAKGVDNSSEKIYALDTAKRVERGLKRAGYGVVMTRKSDKFMTLPSRVAISNRRRGAIFVSIHYNWARNSGASGTETFYFNSKSYPLAANIQRELARFSNNRGVKRARFHVLRNNLRPSALVECGFLSNSGDARKVRSSSHRQRLADAIVRGIVKSSR
jgi:N-acetylmuramoyl-L-alanine amidase